ncbi:hypothetical protein BDR07DRAFT_1475182 [Suillus spraguei]|nr:hypothetical protein BDR07DRAFT_1475182 [Suillus spraguei]
MSDRMAVHAGPPGPSNYYHYPYGAAGPFPGQYQRYPVPMNGHIHRPIFHPHYNYHQPHPAPYVPRSTYWQQHGQQPLSPLPKQLSTLPSLQSSGVHIGNQNIEPEETP